MQSGRLKIVGAVLLDGLDMCKPHGQCGPAQSRPCHCLGGAAFGSFVVHPARYYAAVMCLYIFSVLIAIVKPDGGALPFVSCLGQEDAHSHVGRCQSEGLLQSGLREKKCACALQCSYRDFSCWASVGDSNIIILFGVLVGDIYLQRSLFRVLFNHGVSLGMYDSDKA